jgi:hypothetical protein
MNHINRNKANIVVFSVPIVTGIICIGIIIYIKIIINRRDGSIRNNNLYDLYNNRSFRLKKSLYGIATNPWTGYLRTKYIDPEKIRRKRQTALENRRTVNVIEKKTGLKLASQFELNQEKINKINKEITEIEEELKKKAPRVSAKVLKNIQETIKTLRPVASTEIPDYIIEGLKNEDVNISKDLLKWYLWQLKRLQGSPFKPRRASTNIYSRRSVNNKNMRNTSEKRRNVLAHSRMMNVD